MAAAAAAEHLDEPHPLPVTPQPQTLPEKFDGVVNRLTGLRHVSGRLHCSFCHEEFSPKVRTIQEHLKKHEVKDCPDLKEAVLWITLKRFLLLSHDRLFCTLCQTIQPHGPDTLSPFTSHIGFKCKTPHGTVPKVDKDLGDLILKSWKQRSPVQNTESFMLKYESCVKLGLACPHPDCAFGRICEVSPPKDADVYSVTRHAAECHGSATSLVKVVRTSPLFKLIPTSTSASVIDVTRKDAVFKQLLGNKALKPLTQLHLLPKSTANPKTSTMSPLLIPPAPHTDFELSFLEDFALGPEERQFLQNMTQSKPQSAHHLGLWTENFAALACGEFGLKKHLCWLLSKTKPDLPAVTEVEVACKHFLTAGNDLLRVLYPLGKVPHLLARGTQAVTPVQEDEDEGEEVVEEEEDPSPPSQNLRAVTSKTIDRYAKKLAFCIFYANNRMSETSKHKLFEKDFDPGDRVSSVVRIVRLLYMNELLPQNSKNIGLLSQTAHLLFFRVKNNTTPAQDAPLDNTFTWRSEAEVQSIASAFLFSLKICKTLLENETLLKGKLGLSQMFTESGSLPLKRATSMGALALLKDTIARRYSPNVPSGRVQLQFDTDLRPVFVVVDRGKEISVLTDKQIILAMNSLFMGAWEHLKTLLAVALSSADIAALFQARSALFFDGDEMFEFSLDTRAGSTTEGLLSSSVLLKNASSLGLYLLSNLEKEYSKRTQPHEREKALRLLSSVEEHLLPRVQMAGGSSLRLRDLLSLTSTKAPKATAWEQDGQQTFIFPLTVFRSRHFAYSPRVHKRGKDLGDRVFMFFDMDTSFCLALFSLLRRAIEGDSTRFPSSVWRDDTLSSLSVAREKLSKGLMGAYGAPIRAASQRVLLHSLLNVNSRQLDAAAAELVSSFPFTQAPHPLAPKTASEILALGFGHSLDTAKKNYNGTQTPLLLNTAAIVAFHQFMLFPTLVTLKEGQSRDSLVSVNLLRGEEPTEVARKLFARIHPTFTPRGTEQEAAIAASLRAENVLVLLPPNWGKTSIALALAARTRDVSADSHKLVCILAPVRSTVISLASQFDKAGIPVLVFDPNDPQDGATLGAHAVLFSIELFASVAGRHFYLSLLQHNRVARVIIDEAAIFLTHQTFRGVMSEVGVLMMFASSHRVPRVLLSASVCKDAVPALARIFQLSDFPVKEIESKVCSYPPTVELEVFPFKTNSERDERFIGLVLYRLSEGPGRVLVLVLSKRDGYACLDKLKQHVDESSMVFLSSDTNQLSFKQSLGDESKRVVIATSILAQSHSLDNLATVICLGAYTCSDLFQAVSRTGRKATALVPKAFFLHSREEYQAVFGTDGRFSASLLDALTPFQGHSLTQRLKLAYSPLGVSVFAHSKGCRRAFFAKLFSKSPVTCESYDAKCDRCQISMRTEEQDRDEADAPIGSLFEEDFAPPHLTPDPRSLAREQVFGDLESLFAKAACFLCERDSCSGFRDGASVCKSREVRQLVSKGFLCFLCGAPHKSSICNFERTRTGFVPTSGFSAHCKLCFFRVHQIHPPKQSSTRDLEECKARGGRLFAALTAIFHTAPEHHLRVTFQAKYGELLSSPMPCDANTNTFWSWCRSESTLGSGMRHLDLLTAFLAHLDE